MNASQLIPGALAGMVNRALSRMTRFVETSPPTHDPREHLSSGNPFPERPRALLVDDERVNHFEIEALLLPRGIEPIHAADGAEAVALACGHHFDPILMDIQMPVLDGLHATAKIRRHEREHGHLSAPIIAYTSGSLADDEDALRAFGFDGALAKPCSAVSLDDCLARWCGVDSRPVRRSCGAPENRADTGVLSA